MRMLMLTKGFKFLLYNVFLKASYSFEMNH